MPKNKEMTYVWTEKAERVFGDKAKAGTPATYYDSILTSARKAVVDVRIKAGFIRPAGFCLGEQEKKM